MELQEAQTKIDQLSHGINNLDVYIGHKKDEIDR